MVSFNCDRCGNGFRKNQVESHMYQCGSNTVSCIDCSKNFDRNEFKQHIRCITESEKYESKSSFVQKANKGDVKQNAWFENVVSAVETFRGSQRAKELLEKLTEFPNIPRKKAKFFNFMKNSFRSYGVHDGLLAEIWTVIESFDKKPAQPVKAVAAPTPEKRKAEEVTAESVQPAKKLSVDKTETTSKEQKKFDWIESSKLECGKKDNNEISFKKLFKKLLKDYKKTSEAEHNEIELDELKKKLNKKLGKKPSVFELTSPADESDIDHMMVKCIA